MSTINNTRFDAEAAAWDSNPDVHKASDGALQALLERIPRLKKGGSLNVLEIGCGTGISPRLVLKSLGY
jgi:predicted TPR repeat methyltransferase